ncbi:MAG: 16S rRNA (guanine(966)-N(2))-methyltransferase RsmD [Parabacteroides distasonis]|nr:16S rRNA (guanine(966)-N(2))-methyltransferase RsmD [Parabacteroides distasonis]MBQ4161290.1 16S rRNA (guanine(966)-N(2))-methyltransferase RsmD [Parabacteroides sp.]
MRIISGIYGRRRFDVPSSFSARPTTDFAKENIFNVISNYIDFEGLDALDLFAGTGSISFELLSRECRSVTAVEKNNAHASFISKVAKELKTNSLHLIRGDVFRYLNTAPSKSFDFIFADPPYALKELPEVPSLIFERDLLRDGGIFVMEHPKTNDFSNLPYFCQHRVYGSVNFSIFIKEEEKIDA